MFGSQVLEVAMGLVLMYMLLSLVSSSIRAGRPSDTARVLIAAGGLQAVWDTAGAIMVA
jgi:hypothetical protein